MKPYNLLPRAVKPCRKQIVATIVVQKTLHV